MAQPSDSDYSQPSGASGTDIRTNEADYFSGILTKNSGATAPSTTFPFMWWIDTSASPPELNIRNSADSAWIKVAEIDTSDVKLFSELAALVALASANVFTETQTIDETGSAGVMVIKSDRTTGIGASVDFGGHDDGATDTIYASIDMEITDDTNGAESAQIVLRVLQAGSEVARMTIGSTVSVTGTLNATTLQQGGVGVSSLIETAAGNAAAGTAITATTRTVPDDLTRGIRNRFTGSSPSTWTINTGTAGNSYPVRNRGTADITFAAGTATIVGGTTLAPGGVCTIEYDVAGTALIYGQNT